MKTAGIITYAKAISEKFDIPEGDYIVAMAVREGVRYPDMGRCWGCEDVVRVPLEEDILFLENRLEARVSDLIDRAVEEGKDFYLVVDQWEYKVKALTARLLDENGFSYVEVK